MGALGRGGDVGERGGETDWAKAGIVLDALGTLIRLSNEYLGQSWSASILVSIERFGIPA